MKDPSRWVELSSDEFERDLLRSSRGDVATERAYRRTLTSLGVGFLLPIGASQVAEGAQAAAITAVAPAKSLGAAVLVKWLGSGMLLGVVAASGIGMLSHANRRAPAAGAAVASVTSRTQAESPLRLGPRSIAVPSSFSAPGALPGPGEVERRSARAAKSHPAAPVTVRPEPAPPPVARPAPKLADVTSIEREVRLLDSARSAIARNDSAHALAVLRRYAEEFEHGALAPEARVLEVRALLQAGERDRANALGSHIIASDPQSQHASTLRALLGRASNP